MSDANSRQVGGNHYKTKYEHWDFVEDIRLSYLESVAIKYIARWRQKNGLQDLQKADHYLQKLIEIDRLNWVSWIGLDDKLSRFLSASVHYQTDAEIISTIVKWTNLSELRIARLMIQDLMQSAPREDSNKHHVSAPTSEA